MGRRKRVGFIFSYNENWIAGTYYLLNIICALDTIDDGQKPIVVLLTDDADNEKLVRDQTHYPYIETISFPKKLSLIQRGFNKVARRFGITLFSDVLKNPKIDLLYPNQHPKVQGKNLKKVYWIPDFQEEFLPQFFSKKEIAKRKKYQTNIVSQGDYVVFSSKDAQSHFHTLYPKAPAKSFVIPFAVTHPDISTLDTVEILKKHKLPKKYFFTPNQFWGHKNHIIILKAIKRAKDEGTEVFVAFSGKDYDYRNQEYVSSLKMYIKEHNLASNVSFLGFLDRKEQLLILKNSIAVVQPSLFEGWSTVVEDAKALEKHILLSDLDVHFEQVNEQVDFFERTNEQALATLLKKYFLLAPKNENKVNYSANIHKFGSKFLEFVQQTT